MHYTLEMLVRGRAEVVEYYRLAAEHWREIWSRPEAQTLETLATMLRHEQAWFERNCGGGSLGQEIMVISGLVGLFDTTSRFNGNLERARLLSDAFGMSFCSGRVLYVADEITRFYHIFGTSRV